MARYKEIREDEIFYKDYRFLVSTKLFRTTRQTYQLSRVEKTEVRRSFFPFIFPLVVASLYFCYAWQRFMYDQEIMVVCIVSATLLLFSLVFGTLSIHSKALGEIAAFGTVKRLQRVRTEIDFAIESLDYGMDYENKSRNY
jgi:hypothetical protein